MAKRYTEKKRRTPFLPDATFTFEDTAAVMLRTSFQNHQFVAAFNAAYRLRLSRVDDLRLENGDHPCYSHYDDLARLAYVVVARPAVATGPDSFDYYDKLLLIRGRDAWDFQQRFYADLTEPRPAPPLDEPLARQHWELLNQLNEGVFGLDTFGFSTRQGIATTLHIGPVEVMPRSTTAYLKRLQAFLSTLFETLQWHLCLEEEDL